MPHHGEGVLPESVELRHLAGQAQNVAFFDKRKVIPILGYQLGYKFKVNRYDEVITLAAGENNPHDICYDWVRNRIWIICWTSPGIVIRMNPDDLTYDAVTLVENKPYRIAFDGKWIWIATDNTPSDVIRMDPNTMAYEAITLPVGRNYGAGLCVAELPDGAIRVFNSNFLAGAPWNCYIQRFDPDDWPNYDEVDIGAYHEMREVVFCGQYVWAGGHDGRIVRIDPTTMASALVATIDAGFGHIFAGCWDGSYLWWGDDIGQICKFDPAAYAYDIMTLEGGVNLVHAMRSDGRYIHVVDYGSGHYYIVHPETMSYQTHEITAAGLHGICFDGTNIWLVDGSSVPGVVYRVLSHDSERKVEHRLTETFSTAAIANISIAQVFDVPFIRAPIVIVSLNDLSDKNAEVVSVEADSVTVNGFNAGCRVAAAGAGGSTAIFMWIATERGTHNP